MLFSLSAGFRLALHSIELNLTSQCIAFYNLLRGEELKLLVERSLACIAEPVSQGTYKLEMWVQNIGSLDMPIVARGEPIKVKVLCSRYLPRGSITTNIRLRKGTDIVSGQVPFTIID